MKTLIVKLFLDSGLITLQIDDPFAD